jgi:hypothetical protein
MNLLESILKAQGGGTISQLANQFGLNENQASSAVESLLPALAGGLHRNISQGGLTDLLGALQNGRHQEYIDNPSALGSEYARDEGNGILGHILGSKDVSRRVAAQASQRTGINESILKKMLPAVAALAMGAMSKQAQPELQGAQETRAGASSTGSGILAMLTPLLDRNRDGSLADDILGSVSQFFKK